MAMFNCPKCYKTIAELPKSGSVIAMCSDCRFKYEVVRGKLLERSTSRASGQRDNPTRHYHLKLEVQSGRAEVTEFDYRGLEEVVHAQRADDMAVVYSMRGARREELLAIHNLTTGESHGLGRPGQKSSTYAAAFGFAAGAIVFGVLVGPYPFLLALGVAGATWAGLAKLLRMFLAPVHKLPADQRSSLERTHTWLAEKLRLVEARTRVVGDIADRQRVRQRLIDLRRKMLEVGLDAYRARLASIDVALAALDRQMTLDLSLRDGYDRSIKMIEIEQEASTADELFPEDLTPVVIDKLEELKALEAQQKDLARELEANAEIEQLLRSGRSAPETA